MCKQDRTHEFTITRTKYETANIGIVGETRPDALYKLVRQSQDEEWMDGLSWSEPSIDEAAEITFKGQAAKNETLFHSLDRGLKLTKPEIKHITKSKESAFSMLALIDNAKRFIGCDNWLKNGIDVGCKPLRKRFDGSFGDHLELINARIGELQEFFLPELMVDDCAGVYDLEWQFDDFFADLEEFARLLEETLLIFCAARSIAMYHPSEVDAVIGNSVAA